MGGVTYRTLASNPQLAFWKLKPDAVSPEMMSGSRSMKSISHVLLSLILFSAASRITDWNRVACSSTDNGRAAPAPSAIDAMYS